MEWMPQQFIPTITGLDVALWAFTYVAWRYLSGLSRTRAACPAVTETPRVTATQRVAARRLTASRFEQRAVMLEKVQVGAPRSGAPRRLKRAA
jgi:hypothetical protein